MTHEQLRQLLLAWGNFSPLETANVTSIVKALNLRKQPQQLCADLALMLARYIDESSETKGPQ